MQQLRDAEGRCLGVWAALPEAAEQEDERRPWHGIGMGMGLAPA